MKFRLLSLAVAIAALLGPDLRAQDTVVKRQYGNIKPEWKCHFGKPKKGFCKLFPNFARKINYCDPEVLGTIVWDRKEYTKTELDEDGCPVTYDAVDVTYRYVYSNGGWGTCFTRTYRKGPQIVEPPVLDKAVVAK